jgi:hypothetical protein
LYPGPFSLTYKDLCLNKSLAFWVGFYRVGS